MYGEKPVAGITVRYSCCSCCSLQQIRHREVTFRDGDLMAMSLVCFRSVTVTVTRIHR